MKTSRLREIIKEEVQNIINEGTRWGVGVEAPSGKVISTYGHYDGYPSWVGKHLKRYYNNSAKVKELMKLGKQGISTLGKKIKGSKDHSFDKPDKDVTVFYGRDRGEKGNATSKWKDRDAILYYCKLLSKTGAPIYIGVCEGDKSGRGRMTDSAWQANLKLSEYHDAVMHRFKIVSATLEMITAVKDD